MRTLRNVLVVDDEPNIRLVFRTALGQSGYTVLEAKDGQEALDRLRLEIEPVDVVLLDLLMPGLGGIEVLRRLRDRGDETPVVIVTAHGTIPDAVEAMKLGAIDFLSKPLSPEALRRVVADVIARHAARGPETEADTDTEGDPAGRPLREPRPGPRRLPRLQECPVGRPTLRTGTGQPEALLRTLRARRAQQGDQPRRKLTTRAGKGGDGDRTPPRPRRPSPARRPGHERSPL
jgi:CheY-like chemotaxis protein